MAHPPRLSFVGCGRAGQALGRLWHAASVFRTGDILTRSPETAERAAETIGAGNPVSSFDLLQSADFYLIATPDHAIQYAAAELHRRGLVGANTILFHLSGALGASVLAGNASSASCVSCHPARSFADFDSAIENFGGTWCAIEGDPAAAEVVGTSFRNIGANTFHLDAGNKLAYHAASVMASNYLNALVASAVDCYGLAGIEPAVAQRIIEPMLKDTAHTIFDSDPFSALTGPIRRGDSAIVEQELLALGRQSPALAELYRLLGLATVDLVARNDALQPTALARLHEALADRLPLDEEE